MADAMTIEDREARVVTIDTRLTEIDEDYDGQLMPDQVRDEWNGLNDEREEHVKALRELRARKERIANLARTNPQATERVNGDGGVPVVIRRRGAEIYDLTRIRAESRSDEDYRARLHENARRAIEQAKFGAVRGRATKEDAQGNVERLLDAIDDEHGTLAKRILATGSPEYERYFAARLAGRHDVPRPQAALSTTDSDLAVPFQLDPTIILTSDGAINPLRQICRVEQVVGKSWQGVASTGITVSRDAEASEVSDDAPTMTQPAVDPTAVRGFVPFSIESDQDWMQLRAEMTRLLQDAKDVEEASSFVTGNGTPPNASGIQATLSTSANVTEAAGAFTAAELYKIEEALPERFLPRARWLGRRATYNLVRALDTAGGGTLWVRIGAGLPPELLGYSAYVASAMPARNTATSSRYLLFGDFQQFLIVDKVGMSMELIPHLFHVSNNRPSGQRGLFAMWRNNSGVLAANAFRILVANT